MSPITHMGITDAILYVSLFVSLFFEVFLLITYIELREELKSEEAQAKLPIAHYPSVSIIVPCYNEESTVAATVHSLLALDYPKDKLDILIIDDGSIDSTQGVLNEFRNNSQIKIFYKENGGKHTALNFALNHVRTDLVGCLDADSFVAEDALVRIVPFFSNPQNMAVTPAVKVHEPHTVLQHVQKMEYSWGVLLRRILASIDGLYVTPGPFSIFRTEVFKKVGGYRQAHHTEDMELALRMQRHGLKIVNAHGAHVYTVAPARLGGLYKQRVRWSYGFLNNAIDYRDMYFNPKYGSLGLFVLPVATFSIFSTLFAASQFVWGMLKKIPDVIVKYQAVGFGTPHLPHISFDWFFVNTGVGMMLFVVGLSMSLILLALSLQLSDGKIKFSRSIVYYLTIYMFIVPFWLAKATYSTVRRQQITWR